jgi:phage gpG-like protein
MDLRIELDGHDNLKRMIRAMPEVTKQELTWGVNQAALLGEREAKSLVGVKTGHLRRSIISTPASSVGGSVSAMYGTNTLYAKHHEFGTKPHTIVPRRAKALRFQAGGRTVFARKVNHPGTAGRFYMRNSRIKVQAALPRIGQSVLQRIAKRWAGGG